MGSMDGSGPALLSRCCPPTDLSTASLSAVSTSGRHVALRVHNQMALHQPADSAKSPVWRLSTGSGMTRLAMIEDRLCVRTFLQIIFNLFATRILTYSYLEHRG